MADYVNPFGGYLSGYTQGADLEDRLQQSTRTAREADWKNKYINPNLATQSNNDTQLSSARLPFEEKSLPLAYDSLRYDNAGKQLGLGERIYADTQDPTGIHNAATAVNPNFTPQSPNDEAARNDFPRIIEAQNAAANLAYHTAVGQADLGKASAAETSAGARAAAAAPHSSFTNRFATPPAAPAAPASAPAVTPGATPAAPAPTSAAPATESAPSDQGGGVAQVTPFHQLNPHAMAHVVHYTSQLTGHTPEAVASHIASQYHDPYNPGQTSNPNDPTSYYAHAPGATTNFTTA